jgi:predicted kinase
MVKVVIMQGVPGSGKSSYVKSLRPVATVVCSADTFFESWSPETGATYNFDPSKLGEAHGECLLSFVDAMEYANQDGDTVVVDNTNTTAMEIAPYMALANAYGCEVEIVRVQCDPEIAAARNIHGVPLASIRRMADNIANFHAPPFWRFKLTEV